MPISHYHFDKTASDESKVLDLEGEVQQTTLSYGIGIDTHSKFIYVCVLVKIEMEVKRFEQTFETTWSGLCSAKDWTVFVLRTKPVPRLDDTDIIDLHYTIESTSVYHYPVLRAWGGHPHVINPLLASPSRRKTDALDAKLLAYQDMTGLWPSSFVVLDGLKTARVLMAQRETHRNSAARTSNQINNYVIRYGCTIGRLGSVTASHDVRNVVMSLTDTDVIIQNDICPDGLPEEIKTVIKEMYEFYDSEKTKQKTYETLALKVIQDLEFTTGEGEVIKGSRLMQILKSIPGIGDLSAAIIITQVCDINRFPNAKSFSAFSGLDPSLKVSANHVTSTVKRGGNKALHEVFNNSASILIRNHKDPFGRWGYRLYQGSQKWRKATSAVARRLSVAVYHVWSRGEEFSYEKYKLDTRQPVMEISTEMLIQIEPFFHRYKHLLIDCGVGDTTKLVQMYEAGEFRDIKGCGKKFLSMVHEFIINQHKYEQILADLVQKDGE